MTTTSGLSSEETTLIPATEKPSDNDQNVTDEDTENLEIDFESSGDIIETERNGKEDKVGGIQIRRRKENDKVETKFYTFG